MADLTSKTPAATYKSVLNVGTADNQELDTTLRVIEDGKGNDSDLKLATNKARVNTALGIGVDPSYALDVTSTSTISASFVNNQDTNLVGLRDQDTTSDTHVAIGAQDNDFIIRAGNAEKLRILSNGKVGINDATPSYQLDVNGTGRFTGQLNVDSHIVIPDSSSLKFGNSEDLQIRHNGSDSYIIDSGTGDMYIRGATNLFLQAHSTNETFFKGISNGAVELYYDNSKKFETTNAGATVTGTLTATVSGNATTATTATNVTVADESSDTSCYPLFVTAATGNLPAKTGSNLEFNSSSGRLTVGGEIRSDKIQITSATDAILTFKMSDDNWGYVEWRDSDNTRHAYAGLDGDHSDFQLKAENDCTRINLWDCLYIKDDKVGINDSSPSYDLDVTGTGRFTGQLNANNNLIVSGNIGIGTSSPNAALHVHGSLCYKTTNFSTAGPTDGLSVSGTAILRVDTSSNNVTIGGFSNGVAGQILHIIKIDTTGRVQLEHNESPAVGTHQKIFLTSGADELILGYGGWTLICDGSNWFSVSNPSGAADGG